MNQQREVYEQCYRLLTALNTARAILPPLAPSNLRIPSTIVPNAMIVADIYSQIMAREVLRYPARYLPLLPRDEVAKVSDIDVNISQRLNENEKLGCEQVSIVLSRP